MTGFPLGGLEFDWDDVKAATNIVKHNVTFEEAATAFLDDGGERIPDHFHSHEEDRFLLLALSYRDRILVVGHTIRGHHVRIINARTAKPSERRRYENVRDGR